MPKRPTLPLSPDVIFSHFKRQMRSLLQVLVAEHKMEIMTVQGGRTIVQQVRVIEERMSLPCTC